MASAVLVALQQVRRHSLAEAARRNHERRGLAGRFPEAQDQALAIGGLPGRDDGTARIDLDPRQRRARNVAGNGKQPACGVGSRRRSRPGRTPTRGCAARSVKQKSVSPFWVVVRTPCSSGRCPALRKKPRRDRGAGRRNPAERWSRRGHQAARHRQGPARRCDWDPRRAADRPQARGTGAAPRRWFRRAALRRARRRGRRARAAARPRSSVCGFPRRRLLGRKPR